MRDNKTIVRRFYEALNNRTLEVLDELVDPGYVEHNPLPGQREGIEGVKDRLSAVIDALDPRFTIEDVVAESDTVVVRWTNSGTNVGSFLGAPATGRPYSIQGIDIYRLRDGKLAEHWDVVDVFGLMVQLGLVPTPQGA